MIEEKTLVITNRGLVPANNLIEGDVVFNMQGRQSKVLRTESKKDNGFLLTVGNYGTVAVNVDQYFFTRTIDDRNRGKGFDRLNNPISMAFNLTDNFNRKNQEIEMLKRPLDLNSREVSIHPYIVGCLLGDGSCKFKNVSISTPDTEIISRLNQVISSEHYFKQSTSDPLTYYITQREIKKRNMGFWLGLEKIGIFGLGSKDKFIPDDYLFGDTESRIELLRGLLDTDGWTGLSSRRTPNVKSRTQFYSVSLKLTYGVKFLVESLGGICTVRTKTLEQLKRCESKKGHNHPVYTVEIRMPSNINPHLLPRKADKFNPAYMLRAVTKISPLAGEHKFVKIITDSPDNRMVIDGGIVILNAS